MAEGNDLHFAKNWVDEPIYGNSPPAKADSSINKIDLPDSITQERFSISANLPDIQDDEWHSDKWHECVDTFPGNSFTPNQDRDPPPATKGGTKEEDRWEFVMKKLINIENNPSNLTRDFNSLNSTVEAQAASIKEVKTYATKNEQKINDLYKRQESIAAEVDQRVEAKFKQLQASFQQENAAFQEQVLEKTDEKVREKVREVTQDMQDDIIQGQCDQRKLNLMFVGIKEKEGEELISVIKTFLRNRMGISGVHVDAAYRLGKSGESSTRPILARFPFWAHRQRIWFAKSKIKTNKEEAKVWIHEDLPKAAKHVQRTFFRVLKKAKSLGDRFEGAHIKGQSLFIDGKAYREETLESLPDVLRPSNLATLQSEEAVAFFGRFSPLSNHHPSPFQVDGRSFTCMEQFLAWSRASLSEDQGLISKALSKADPIVYKGILNDLHNCKPEEWRENLGKTALSGLTAKFQHNPHLAHFLCSTHPKTIGEASLNKTWGIGLTLAHPDVLQYKKWPKNGNLLGRTLMLVRDELLIIKNA